LADERMSEGIEVNLERLQACARRTKNAAERVKLQREEIAKIEAAKGQSADARAILVTFEQALVHHCDGLEMLIEQVEYLLSANALDGETDKTEAGGRR
jgi:hypothetical protein